MEPFDRLYVKHYRTVQSAVSRVLTGAEDREDAEQNTWLKAHTHMSVGGNLSWTWLNQVAQNEAKMIRRNSRIRAADELPEGDTIADDRTCRLVHVNGQAEQVREAISALPDDLRVVLVAHYAGMPQAAIAARLGVSQQAIDKRLKKATKKIRELVVKQQG